MQVDGADRNDGFEERFLQCVGLVDADAEGAGNKTAVTRTASQPSEEERERMLKEQCTNSPW